MSKEKRGKRKDKFVCGFPLQSCSAEASTSEGECLMKVVANSPLIKLKGKK